MLVRLLQVLALPFLLSGAARAQESPLPARLPAVPPATPLQADPAADQFLVAQLAYQEALDSSDPKLQKANFEAAVLQFSRFLRFHAGHKNAVNAWYYSAVCYQKLGQDGPARRCLKAVVEDGRSGPLVGSAAYQLAKHHYEEKAYAEAEPLFALASKESDNLATRQLALYSRALCFQKLEREVETMQVLEEVLADPDSPFRSRAEVALAYYFKNHEQVAKALVLFEKLAETGEKKSRADAILQVALLARELGKEDLARSYSEKILTTPGLEQWRGEAQLSLMSEASRNKNHARVIALYEQGQGRFKLKKDQAVQRILLTIGALEASDRKKDTSPLYQELARLSPESKTGFEAAYVLLSRAYHADTKDFAKRAETFLQSNARHHADDPRTHNVRLMLAESHYKAKSYAKAAATYAVIDLQHLDPENHVGVRYRLANALLESGQHDQAVAAIDAFLKNHANDKQVPTLLAKRADAFAAAGKKEEALRDYETLLTRTSDPLLREYAWAQKAELHKKAKELEAFINCHRHLLTDFPQRSPANMAASQFLIGWALFRLDRLEECISPLENARQGDPKSLGYEATIHLALAHYSLQQLPALEAELQRLLDDGPDEKIGRNVFGWAGVKIANEEEDYSRALKFLRNAIDLDAPAGTKTVIWRSYAKCAVETGEFRHALPALAILLERDENEYLIAESNYLMARSHFGLNALKQARTAAEDALGLKPQGRLNAEIRLLLGDIALGENDPATAAQYYVVVAELYSSKDPKIKVNALRRAAAALEDIGTAEARQDAQRYREQLNSRESAPSGG